MPVYTRKNRNIFCSPFKHYPDRSVFNFHYRSCDGLAWSLLTLLTFIRKCTIYSDLYTHTHTYTRMPKRARPSAHAHAQAQAHTPKRTHKRTRTSALIKGFNEIFMKNRLHFLILRPKISLQTNFQWYLITLSLRVLRVLTKFLWKIDFIFEFYVQKLVYGPIFNLNGPCTWTLM